MIEVTFRAVAEDLPGAVLLEQFERTWPAYRAWYLREGEAPRPSYVQCRRMLREHLPELVPTWERLVELVGGGDLEARFLSLYDPPAFVAGCTQALWTHRTPALVRNYDYAPSLFDGLILRSAWNGTAVVAMTDCVWGVLDGVNAHGLAVSLAYGGRHPVGDGFAITVVLRYILEFCSEVAEAVEVLKRVPIHVGYNVALLDRQGRHATVFVAPDRPARVEPWLVSANRQAQDAEAGRPERAGFGPARGGGPGPAVRPGLRAAAGDRNFPGRARLARPGPPRLGHPLHRLLPAGRGGAQPALARQRVAPGGGPVRERAADGGVPRRPAASGAGSRTLSVAMTPRASPRSCGKLQLPPIRGKGAFERASVEARHPKGSAPAWRTRR